VEDDNDKVMHYTTH